MTISLGRHHPPHHRHREKRFHIRPEALGRHFEHFDVLSRTAEPSQASAEPAAEIREEEPLSEKEEARRRALEGIRACFVILVGFLVSLQLGWLFQLYLWLVEAYSWAIHKLTIG